MNSRRRLIVHTGPVKTGSSALQAYFSANQAIMGNRHIGYLNAPPIGRPDAITSGNGMPLFKAMTAEWNQGVILKMLSDYCADQPLSICSSEHLASIGPETWALFGQACEHLSIQPTFVVFARGVEAFYMSSYNQAVKRLGESAQYANYVMMAREKYRPLKHVRSLIEIFGADAVKLICYEEACGAIDIAFWESLDLSHEPFDRRVIAMKVNRSLVSCELEFVRMLNRATGAKYSTQLSDHLIYARPDITDIKPYDPTILPLLREWHQSDVDWANAVFFKGRTALKVAADPVSNQIPPSEALTREIQADVMAWLVERLADSGINANPVSSQLAECIHRISKDEEALLAKFFDAPYYLKTYPDIAVAKVDPLLHYRHRGILEQRRPRSDISGFLEALLLTRERKFRE